MSKVLIAGGTGLVGNRLSQLLVEAGYEVVHLSRAKRLEASYPTFVWNTEKSFIDDRAFHGLDYIINLAGAGIADTLWTKSRKKLLIDSRVKTTEFLTTYIKKLDHKPKAFLSAAAIGIYGDRGNEVLTENSAIGKKGFLVECCTLWERAIKLAALENGVRTAALRIGVVLSTQGGALAKMLLPLKFFIASYFGNGKQWYSWIHIDDICGMFIHLMKNEQAVGFYNATSPNPLTNKDLTKQMVKALGKKVAIIPAPVSGLRMGMGEMADVVLHSNRVLPERMEKEGYLFKFPNFQAAILDLSNRGI